MSSANLMTELRLKTRYFGKHVHCPIPSTLMEQFLVTRKPVNFKHCGDCLFLKTMTVVFHKKVRQDWSTSVTEVKTVEQVLISCETNATRPAEKRRTARIFVKFLMVLLHKELLSEIFVFPKCP